MFGYHRQRKNVAKFQKGTPSVDLRQHCQELHHVACELMFKMDSQKLEQTWLDVGGVWKGTG